MYYIPNKTIYKNPNEKSIQLINKYKSLLFTIFPENVAWTCYFSKAFLRKFRVKENKISIFPRWEATTSAWQMLREWPVSQQHRSSRTADCAVLFDAEEKRGVNDHKSRAERFYIGFTFAAEANPWLYPRATGCHDAPTLPEI